MILPAVAFALSFLGIGYFLFTFGVGLAAARRSSTSPRPDDPRLRVVALIAALNEEAVIRQTVSRLLDQGVWGVVVVDDGSDDDTGAIARSLGGRVLVVRRELPNARQGKGMALNTGIAALRGAIRSRGLDPASFIVCVMDADGRLSDGAVEEVKGLFTDPAVGGVQLPVRIRNRSSWLTRVQDYEFWGSAAVGQLARSTLGTVSLGGNGQFTRLVALNQLGASPWSECLTEDLDLALRVLGNGWKLTSTDRAHVDQQAVTRIRALIRQRTRWFQGHLSCVPQIGRLARTPELSMLGFLESSLYLLAPLMIMLPWSALWILGGRAVLTAGSVTWTNAREAGWEVAGLAAVLAYAITFGPSLIAGLVYWRRSGSGLMRAVAIAHGSFLLQPVYWWCCWRAAYRIVRGRNGWDKTSRVTEACPTRPRRKRRPQMPVVHATHLVPWNGGRGAHLRQRSAR